jgi:hypothetical protein
MRRWERVRAQALGVVLLLAPLSLPASAAEGDSAERATVRKTREQLHFELPADWPVEKRGGIVAPIPVEEYLAMKFKALESRLQTIEQRLNGFDVRLRVMEEAMKSKNPQQGLRSSGTPQP